MGNICKFFFPSVNAHESNWWGIGSFQFSSNVKLFSKEALPTDTSHRQFYIVTNIGYDQIFKKYFEKLMCFLLYFKILLTCSSLITTEFEHISLSHCISHLNFLFVKFIHRFSIHFFPYCTDCIFHIYL